MTFFPSLAVVNGIVTVVGYEPRKNYSAPHECGAYRSW